MDAELRYLLTVANDKNQYDTYVKRLLSKKCILSYILTAAVDEFKGMAPGEAERCIEGRAYAGRVPFRLMNGPDTLALSLPRRWCFRWV